MDLRKVRESTSAVAGMAARSGMSITGVTKATCGDPRVARAMLEGGASSIGDSRTGNLRRLREAGVDCDLMLLRTPMPDEVPEVVECADISLNSEREVLMALGREAAEAGKDHRVLLMVEMGELREGIRPEDVEGLARQVMETEGLTLEGVGMNLACLSGVVPTAEKMEAFEELAGGLERSLGTRFAMVGGGNSANIPMLSGPRRGRTDNLRVGEGILLGLETVERTPIPGTHQDAFVLEAQLIEVQRKPTVPDGRVSQNAFGETPEFEDLGEVRRGILALGRQDVIVEDLASQDPDVKILASSSDHVVVRLPEGDGRGVGDVLGFTMRYGGLVHAFTSPYVGVEYRNG